MLHDYYLSMILFVSCEVGGFEGVFRDPGGGQGNLPESFPPVSEALRHDWYGFHRGTRVLRHLPTQGITALYLNMAIKC